MNRYIDLQGTYNFRDIGGYHTKSGKRVAFGKLFRSDELSRLTPEDVIKIKALGIRTIIDFRNTKERENNEDIPIEGVHVQYLDPVADIAALASSEFTGGKKLDLHDPKNMTAELAKHLMIEQNVAFVHDKKCQKAYREMFHVILQEENIGIVQHCRGGKDRTGYGIALILFALGVSSQDIIKDYMLTNHYKKEKNEASLKALLKETKNEDLVQAIRYFKEANEVFLQTALNEIKAHYQNPINYIQTVLGITESQIKTLEKLYLVQEKKNG